MTIPVLSIQNLKVSVDNNVIIDNLNFNFFLGETVALLGPNGSGKSTLGKVLAGHPSYKILEGTIHYMGQNITEIEPDIRANMGIYLGFQNPVEIPGVKNLYFLKNALNLKMQYLKQQQLDSSEFLKLTKQMYGELELSKELIDRELNKGSGGENKRNEIFHMYVLRPTFVVLDEIDSGLDIDAVKIVGENINNYRSPDNTIVLITHYSRLFDYVKPDRVLIFKKGNIIKEGNIDLLAELESNGYKQYETR
jgi:Fe-S cluster assembly ATP-binding protein